MKSKRYIEYDIMRIIACFCVIMIHAAVFDQIQQYDYRTLAFQMNSVYGTLSRWAVPAFVMLSGMMTLPKADEVSISKLLIKRVIRMIAVYIAWSAVYSAYNVYALNIVYAPTKFKTFIDGCFSGEIHMWYLLMLAGLYACSPILSVMLKKLDGKWLVYWLCGMGLFSSVIPFLVKLDIKFISTIISSFAGYMDVQFLGGWTIYYVLGYCIQNHSFTRKQSTMVYAAALLSFVFTFYATVIYAIGHEGKSMGILPYEYPNIVLYSVGVVLLFKNEVSRIRISNRSQKMIESLSRLTFGIYLAHVLVLKVLYACGICVSMAHPVITIPFVSFVTFAVAAIMIWILRKIPIIGAYLA